MSDPSDPSQPNPPDARRPHGFPSREEFERWLRADPANVAKLHALLKRTALGEYGDLTPELRESTRATIAKYKEYRCIEIVEDKMKALTEVLRRPLGTTEARERIDECSTLADEITDALLETPEPHRTTFLKMLLPVREKLRAMNE